MQPPVHAAVSRSVQPGIQDVSSLSIAIFILGCRATCPAFRTQFLGGGCLPARRARFTLAGMAPGTLHLTAWHEVFGRGPRVFYYGPELFFYFPPPNQPASTSISLLNPKFQKIGYSGPVPNCFWRRVPVRLKWGYVPGKSANRNVDPSTPKKAKAGPPN